MARYFKERGRPLRRDSLAVGWGECTRYIEIADDRYAARQVEVFDEGQVLRYDRSHWCDNFGQLFGCLFSHKRKAIAGRANADVIDATEFDRAWHAALQSSHWAQQVALSRRSEWGEFSSQLQQLENT